MDLSYLEAPHNRYVQCKLSAGSSASGMDLNRLAVKHICMLLIPACTG